MNTRFYIEKRKNEDGRSLEGSRPVFLSVSFSGQRLRIGTGIKVEIHGWDNAKQQVKSSFPDSDAYNQWLESLADAAAEVFTGLSSEGEPVTAEHFLHQFRKMKPEYSGGFFPDLYLFMEINSSRWSTSTYRKVRTFYDHLREFQDHATYRLSYKQMNRSFLEDFVRFYQEKRYRPATIQKSVNILVWFLNWSADKGHHIYREYRNFYKWLDLPAYSSPQKIYLTWEELMAFREAIPENRKMERVRDMFCFMCFTGVRFVEIQALKKGDVAGDRITIRKSSGKERSVPLNKHAKSILQVYESKYYLNNAAFPPISAVTMNKYLKILARHAGLTREVSSGSNPANRVPLYTSLTAGAAVHTFIACALELEIPVEIISSLTGEQHKRRIRSIQSKMAIREISKFNTIG